MKPTKLIVQGIPCKFCDDDKFEGCFYFGDCPCESREERLKRKSKFLKQLFSTFGPADCTYFYEKNYPVENIFAHIVFQDPQDAFRAWTAGVSRKIKINNEILTLTLVSADESPIGALNDDCLMRIFSVLNKEEWLIIEKVCSRWEKVVESCWVNQKSLDLDNPRCNLQDIESYVLRCGEYVNRLVFTTRIKSPVYPLSLIGNHCKNVHELIIDLGHGATDEDEFCKIFSTMLENMADLTNLQVDSIHEDLSFAFVKTLPPNMSRISFSAEPKSRNARRPLSLDLSRFRNLTDLTLKKFAIDAGALRGFENLEHFISLNFDGSRVHTSYIQNVQSLTKLRHLSVPDCQLDDDILLSIVANNRELEDLDISSNNSLTDGSLMAVSTLPKLKRLHMTQLYNVEFIFMDEMPELEELNCKHCPDIGHVGLTKLVLTSPKLKSLNMINCNTTRDFLVSANLAVKMRDNGLVLELATSDDGDIENEGISPLLRIKYFRRRDDNDDYDYDSDEDDFIEISEGLRKCLST